MGGKARVASLQLVRFVAATMVVAHHSISLARGYVGNAGLFETGRLADLGGIGVDVFFVISGFVISLTGPLAARRPTAAEFYLRRWARVAPLCYILTIPTLFTWRIRTPVSPWGATFPISGPQVIATLVFWPSAGWMNVPPILSNGWTLCFEMFFYSMMALVLLGGRVRLMTAIILLGFAAATVSRTGRVSRFRSHTDALAYERRTIGRQPRG
jgi:exopolysaccharide production protein ExoZ